MTELRTRRAEAIRKSSDLTRQRGLLRAAVLGALLVVAALAARYGPRSLAAPGPLAKPHAGVACTSCHAPADWPASTSVTPPGSLRATCDGCHAAHSARGFAHRALVARGELACGDCHAVHRSESGVAFSADGAILAYGTGYETRVRRGRGGEPASASRAGERPTTFVPLIAASACARCHDLADGSDPATPCIAGGTQAFVLCFDEHRRAASATGAAAAERDAAVEHARALVKSGVLTASSSATARIVTNGLYVALGLGAALFVMARRRRAAATAPGTVATAGASAPRLPVIDATRCLGCHACVDACPFDALAVRRYVAILARPEACCGAGPCLESCPNGSLSLVSGAAEAKGPRVSGELESLARPGLFLAGDVTGGSLIRNAVRQGTAVATTIAARVAARPAKRAGATDLIVVGAGPAGLAAALTARALGLSVVVLEQAGVAASIRRFSRHKLVLDAGSAVDEALPLWLGDASKEQLLERWQRALRTARLEIREKVRVLGVTRASARAPFLVSAELAGEARHTFSADHVLLAVGTRGTPRELECGVADSAASRVHYELSDARAFAGQRVVVVGLGDVAMESALALAAQPGTEVTVLHRGAGFRRGSRRNIDALARVVAKGRIVLVFDAQVKRVSLASLEIEVAGLERRLPFEALFVHVGAVPGNALLDLAGVASRG